MRKALSIICLALLFAGTAMAGDVQLLSHQVECISASQDYAFPRRSIERRKK